MLRKREPVSWVLGASLSSWTWFGTEAPSGLILPAGMSGARLAFVGADNGADGLADAVAAQDLYDRAGTKVTLVIPAVGGRLVFAPDALLAQGWLALRSEDGAGAAVVQAAARQAVWLWSWGG